MAGLDWLIVVQRLVLLLGTGLLLAAAPTARADITAHVDAVNHVLVVTGTDSGDSISVSGGPGPYGYSVSELGGAVTAGSGCETVVYFTVTCDRVAGPDDSFSVLIEGLGGDDEILRDYQGTSSGEDPAVIRGGTGNDFIGGAPGPDVIEGGPGNDVLDGQFGDDLVIGGSIDPAPGEDPGQDAIFGGPGSDVLVDGDLDGAGNTATVGPDTLGGGSCPTSIDYRCRSDLEYAGDFDVVDYSDRTEPVTVDLADTGAHQGEAGEGDTVTAVEGAYGGAGDDHLTGDAGPNLLDGGPGQDTIVGGDGDDAIAGGSIFDPNSGAVLSDGRDLLDGGEGGQDELLYYERTTPVTVDLAKTDGQGAAGENDQALGFEDVTAGSANDVLSGSPGHNELYGSGGDDVLNVSGDPRSHDLADCGPGDHDTATADDDDTTSGCEPPAPPITTTPPVTTPPASTPPPPLLRARDVVLGPTAFGRVRAGRHGRVVLAVERVRCPAIGASACVVTARAHAPRHRQVLARAMLRLAPGQTRSLTLRLTRPGRRVLRRARHVRITVSVDVAGAGGGRLSRTVHGSVRR
jgi:Ca2+-binding RTX toxin-like protein